jgi:DNA polymerase sigma
MNKQIFNEIQMLKRQILPDEKLILFGSQARGDARADSDWDLLVILNKEGKRSFEDSTNYGYPFDELGWNNGIAINTIVRTKNQWERGKGFPFYKNVTQEGIEIE